MKKILMIFCAALMWSGCEPGKVAKQYECKEFSAECEMQKDNIVFLPISYDSTVVDAYGDPIVVSTVERCQWYISNIRVGIPIKVGVPVYEGAGENATIKYHVSPSIVLQNWNGNVRNIEIDTIDLSKRVPGIKKVALIVSGPSELYSVPAFNENSVRLATPK